MVYAVIDTNIFVSALITHNSNASTARVLESLFLHRIIPLYNDDIIKEYDEVLHRAKFKLSDDQICTVIELVKQNGIDSSRFPYAGEMPDEDAAKRQEPDQIPEVFRPDSGTGIKSQPECCINESDKDADSNTCDGQDKSVLVVF